MNNKAQLGLAFVAGLTIGSVVAGVIINRKYETLIQEELDSIDEWKKRMEREENAIDVEVETEEIFETDGSVLRYDNPETDRVDYTKPSIEELMDEKGYLVDYEGQEVDDEIDEDERAMHEYMTQPPSEDQPFVDDTEDLMVSRYPISFKAFTEDKPHYDKLTITYYEDDATLADDQDGIIPDIRATIGPDALQHFGWLSGSDDVVYIRNDDISVDFEVIRAEGSYDEIVMGITED